MRSRVRAMPSPSLEPASAAYLRALGRGIEHGVAHVQRERELHDSEREHREEDADECELGDRGPALVLRKRSQPRAKSGSGQNPSTRLIA